MHINHLSTSLNLQRVLLFTYWCLLLLVQATGYSTHINKVETKTDFHSRFFNITVQDGLSNNLVLDIIQDKYGQMWFAAANGLTHFDGFHYTIYHNEPEYEIRAQKWEHASHSANEIEGEYYYHHIFEDSKKNLWVGGKLVGIVQVDLTNNSYCTLQHNPDDRIYTIRAIGNGKGVFFGDTIAYKNLLNAFGNEANLASGKQYELAAREIQVVEYLSQGYSSKEIGALLHTIESHKEHIKNKLGMDTIVEVVVSAIKYSILRLDLQCVIVCLLFTIPTVRFAFSTILVCSMS